MHPEDILSNAPVRLSEAKRRHYFDKGYAAVDSASPIAAFDVNPLCDALGAEIGGGTLEEGRVLWRTTVGGAGPVLGPFSREGRETGA